MQSPAASTNPRVGIWQQAQSRWQLVALPDQHGRGRKEICAARRGARAVEGATGGAPSRRDPARAGGRGHHTVSVSVTHPGRQAAVHGKQPSGCCLALALSRLVAGWRLRPAARAGPRREIQSNHWWPGAVVPFLCFPRLADRYQGVKQGRPAKRRGCVVTTPLTPGNFISGREKGHGVPTRWSSSGSPLSSETARGPQAAATSSDVGYVAAENDLWAACGV